MRDNKLINSISVLKVLIYKNKCMKHLNSDGNSCNCNLHEILFSYPCIKKTKIYNLKL